MTTKSIVCRNFSNGNHTEGNPNSTVIGVVTMLGHRTPILFYTILGAVNPYAHMRIDLFLPEFIAELGTPN